MPFGKGGKICKLGDEGNKALFLIHLSFNEEVPLHSHEGAEHSYVISGSYTADGVQFETGDFSTSTESVTHAPKAGSEDGCLLLSSVENRLNFFQGWLSPLNGLLWWVLSMRVKFIR
jgi:anti-sigma factor ChrR (cupin superfamily)